MRAAKAHAYLPCAVEGQRWGDGDAELHGRGAGSDRGAE
jgi:hypothetical protein